MNKLEKLKSKTAASAFFTDKDKIQKNEDIKEIKDDNFIKKENKQTDDIKKVIEQEIITSETVKVSKKMDTKNQTVGTYMLDRDIIKKIKIECAKNDIKSKDIVGEALAKFKTENIIDEGRKYSKEKRVKKSFILNGDTYESLRKISFEKRISSSEILNRALNEYFSNI